MLTFRILPGTTITVFGATGGTGREVVSQALAQNYRVTVLVRDETRFRAALPHLVRNPNLLVIKGRADNKDDVSTAMSIGQDAVINCLGTNTRDKDVTICSRSQRCINDAMVEHHVRRLIVVTSQGLGGTDDQFNPISHLVAKTVMRKYLDDKRLQEKIVTRDAMFLDYTIVRPSTLNDGPLTEHYKVSEGAAKVVSISRADLANFIVGELRAGEWIGGAATVTGYQPRRNTLTFFGPPPSRKVYEPVSEDSSTSSWRSMDG
ncbi:hypothetical protein BC936DRAFT_148465 [Jimgerdemannia flammicorona]|uniref:Uncharacterized protein n=2 Tax=Jimgerdemannia flammicorona TaxID=994334 RepID=A0A433QEM6_9FUNG|nr:hypothetical protein BC936DRAFT_148465 [Jimgerdemannia flammicorona]RUS28270.1 hypothetical protein BC938DRAFT_482088 [Jimgerdemannia flammicorona]